jgi:hypothetical protein
MSHPQPTGPPDFEGIVLDFPAAFCVHHGEPLRKDWPRGYVLFQGKLLKYIETNEDLAKEAGGNIQNIQLVLHQKPFCCRLTFEEMLAYYEEALEPYMVNCIACGGAAHGGLYALRNYWGRPRGEAYYCYACWLKRGTAKAN